MNPIKNAYISVKFRNEIYEISLDKLLYILRSLTNDSKLALKDEKEILKLLKKYNLLDDIFLRSLNQLW